MNAPTAAPKDPEKLTMQSKAVVLATMNLMATILADLAPMDEQTMVQTLNGGGKVGFEILSDRHSANTIALICVEPEGQRFELAAVLV